MMLVAGERMAAPPTGTVTFLFTDIEGSTRRWDEQPEAMQRGLEPEIPLQVARHACDVPEDDADAPVLASVLRLLDLYDEHRSRLPRRNTFTPGWDLVSAAAVVARTPAAPLP